ncbi:cytochrome c nitrite reductase small subunit [Burkholderiales bacterium]|nr:cytochrome c nitrite reductase small subunit [Burkholderiales bacterium]
MAGNDEATSGGGALSRLWGWLRRPSGTITVLTLLAAGFASGIVFWGGFHTVVEETNTMTFCVSCHEMRDNVYAEYKETIHYSNRTGVRAVCSDCHVPRDWTHKMVRKVQATKELYGKVMGTIATKEKFEAKRLELARHEWARMKASDSRECRNCHSFDGMNTEVQKARAKKSHELGQRDGQTCIDCHKGIAHRKPQGMTEADEG